MLFFFLNLTNKPKSNYNLLYRLKFESGGIHIRTLIVGAGASGLIAAVTAAENGEEVILCERQSKPGRKLSASGNGRCNLMNRGPMRYYGDTEFASKVFSSCPRENILEFWQKHGLILRTDDEGRVYPASYHASSVTEMLIKALKMYNIRLLSDTEIQSVKKDNGLFFSIDQNGNSYQTDRVIIAAGGPAQPSLGGTDIGYRLLCSFGHRLNRPVPALTSLVTDMKSVSGLDGIRTKCGITLKRNETVLHSEKGEVLFTKDGISGICVMQCSRFVTDDEVVCELNLVQDLFEDEKAVLAYITGQYRLYAGFSPTALLEGICLPKLAFAVCKQAGCAMRGETCADLSEARLLDIANCLMHYTLTVKSIKGFEKAQVTAGGISCGDFNPMTMESRLVRGLFATGEVLDVDGDCGGFNLMFAWASGLLAGGRGDDRFAKR